MRKRTDGPPAGFVPFPDYIPAGQEEKYPSMGRGGLGMDHLPQGVHCLDGVEPEGCNLTWGEVKRRTHKGEGTIVPFDAEK